MNKNLKDISDKFIGVMKSMREVIGAWDFGSAMHGSSDEYSDIDAVFLIDGIPIAEAERKVNSALEEICEVILCYEEDFNGEAIVNNGYIISMDGELLQLDVFLLNNDMLDDFMCMIHYTGLTENDIIFDKTGAVKRLAENPPHGSPWHGEFLRLQKTYWYHFNMAAKYLLRRDFFKLNNIFRTLFDTHASLLLSAYDKTTWGGVANKLNAVPNEKQGHLKKYYCTENFGLNRDDLLSSAGLFEADLAEIFKERNIPYKPEIGELFINKFICLTKEVQ